MKGAKQIRFIIIISVDNLITCLHHAVFPYLSSRCHPCPWSGSLIIRPTCINCSSVFTCAVSCWPVSIIQTRSTYLLGWLVCCIYQLVKTLADSSSQLPKNPCRQFEGGTSKELYTDTICIMPPSPDWVSVYQQSCLTLNPYMIGILIC